MKFYITRDEDTFYLSGEKPEWRKHPKLPIWKYRDGITNIIYFEFCKGELSFCFPNLKKLKLREIKKVDIKVSRCK